MRRAQQAVTTAQQLLEVEGGPWRKRGGAAKRSEILGVHHDIPIKNGDLMGFNGDLMVI